MGFVCIHAQMLCNASPDRARLCAPVFLLKPIRHEFEIFRFRRLVNSPLIDLIHTYLSALLCVSPSDAKMMLILAFLPFLISVRGD